MKKPKLKDVQTSLEMKRQICGRKCQCEVKPVPTELEHVVEGHVSSTAHRETYLTH